MATAIIDGITTRYEVVGSGPQIEADLAAELVGSAPPAASILRLASSVRRRVGTKSGVTP
jgi:hypothetical protein